MSLWRHNDTSSSTVSVDPKGKKKSYSPGHDVFWSKEKIESTIYTATELSSGFTLLPVGRQSFESVGILDQGSKTREISSVNLPKISRNPTALARVSRALHHLDTIRVQSMFIQQIAPSL